MSRVSRVTVSSINRVNHNFVAVKMPLMSFQNII